MIANLLLCLCLALSQGHQQQYSPTVADYEEKIEHVKKMSSGVFSSSTWDEVYLKRKSDSKVVEWKSLAEEDRDMFMFVVGIRTLNSILRIEEYWVEEVSRFDNPNHKLVAGPQSRPATQREVKSYLERLQAARRAFVAELRDSGESFFKKYESKLTPEEISGFRKRIEDAK